MSPALGKDEAMLWQAVPPCCALGAVRAGVQPIWAGGRSRMALLQSGE